MCPEFGRRQPSAKVMQDFSLNYAFLSAHRKLCFVRGYPVSESLLTAFRLRVSSGSRYWRGVSKSLCPGKGCRVTTSHPHTTNCVVERLPQFFQTGSRAFAPGATY